MIKKYDALLMLSGGKDSCSLAFLLNSQGLRLLCFTLDNDFLVDTAKSNIDKLVHILDIDSIIVKPRPSEYLPIIGKRRSLVETCTECSKFTLNYALETAKMHNITKVYSGFTKYTAEAQGWAVKPEQEINGITVFNPYFIKYEFPKIKAMLKNFGIEHDPTKTNCKYIRELISRDVDDCFEREIDIMYKADQLTVGEHQYYTDFIKSCKTKVTI